MRQMYVAESRGQAPGGPCRHVGCRLKEKTMELKELIRQLKAKLDDAEMASDIGNREEAREHLRFAKELLDDELNKD